MKRLIEPKFDFQYFICSRMTRCDRDSVELVMVIMGMKLKKDCCEGHEKDAEWTKKEGKCE